MFKEVDIFIDVSFYNFLDAGCPGSSAVFSSQFAVEIGYPSQPEIEKNSLKPFIAKVEGHSTSSMLVPSVSSSAVIVMMCSKSLPICNCSHCKRVNSGKITHFRRFLSVIFSFEFHQILSTLFKHVRVSIYRCLVFGRFSFS